MKTKATKVRNQAVLQANRKLKKKISTRSRWKRFSLGKRNQIDSLSFKTAS